jgi:uroporphyrinogen III methyltransferase/synthase
LNQCVGQLSKHDWVIFTSANGVEAFMDALVTANLDSRAFGRSKIAVIGPGTARPLARWGIVPDLVAQEHVAESLARELLQVGAGKSVLLVRAEVARDTLPNSLREAGLSVTVVASYRTRKLGPEQATHLRTIIEGQGIDAVLLTSSSMADSLASALGPNAPEVLARTCIASIGPITTATLGKLGIRADVTASEYTVAGLLDALEQHFGTTGPAEPRATKTNQ